MRTSVTIAAAGLVAVASAGWSTVTDTVDVTVTSCGPTVTNCPYKPVKPTDTSDPTWGDWEATTTSSIPVDPVKTTTASWEDWASASSSTPVEPVSTTTGSGVTWGDWTTVTGSTPVAPVTTTTPCPVYTATAPPAWLSLLPADVASSLTGKWAGGAPADWCYYTYSTSVPASTPVAPVTTGGWVAPSQPVAPVAPTVWSSTPVAPAAATWTGAANANAGSLALAGLAAAAVMVIA